MIVRRTIGGFLAAALLVGALAGCGEKGKENVAVSYKGGTLTVEDLEAHRKLLSRQSMFRGNPERLTPEFVKEHAVNMEMIIAKGLKEKLHQDPRLRAEIHGFMADLFLKVMQEQLVTKIDRKDLREEEVRAYYEKNKDSYRTPALYGFSVIKSANEAKLAALRKRIASGELSFAAAAERYSSDEQTKKAKGYAGRLPLERVQPGMREELAKLSPKQISGVLKHNDSFYLVQLLEKTEPRQYSYEEKAEYVRNDLLYSHYRDEWEKTYDRLKKEFDVQEHAPVLQRFGKEKPAPAGGA